MSGGQVSFEMDLKLNSMIHADVLRNVDVRENVDEDC